MPAVKETIEDVRQLESDKYKYGFTTEIEQEQKLTSMEKYKYQKVDAKKGEYMCLGAVVEKYGLNFDRATATKAGTKYCLA